MSVVKPAAPIGRHAWGVARGWTLCIAWTMKQEVVGRWLAGQPPWNGKSWERGPVPSHIGVRCSLGTRSVWVVSDATGPRYGGDQQFQQLLGSKNVRYAAENRGPYSLPWHNGNLLIVDTTPIPFGCLCGICENHHASR